MTPLTPVAVDMTFVAHIQTWSEIVGDFELNWLIYLSMPFVAAFIGYTTKLLALVMLYYPLEPRGVGVLKWQGIVPRRAGKMASLTMQSMTGKLLDPHEILDQIDGERVVEQLREPLTKTIDEMARDLAELVRPGLWDQLPEAARRRIRDQVRAAAPGVVDSLVEEMKTDLPLFLDLEYLAVTTLVKNKAQLNDLMKGMAGRPQQFIRRSGIYFGFAIGLLQMVAWAYFHNPWVMPAFGFFTGFVTDWLALNLLFLPRNPKRVLGLQFHGVIQKVRDEVAVNYARIMAQDIFAPDVIFEAILNGPTSDRLFASIQREIARSIDEQTSGRGGTVVSLVVGSARYRDMKATVVARVMERLPAAMEDLRVATGSAFDAEALIRDKMLALSNEEFESVMRPIFKDDEMLMVVVGAALGFLVGELQVVLVEHFSR